LFLNKEAESSVIVVVVDAAAASSCSYCSCGIADFCNCYLEVERRGEDQLHEGSGFCFVS
jgi:hypothetical protein